MNQVLQVHLSNASQRKPSVSTPNSYSSRINGCNNLPFSCGRRLSGFMTRVERHSRISRDRCYVSRGFIPIWGKINVHSATILVRPLPSGGHATSPDSVSRTPARRAWQPAGRWHSRKISCLFQPPMKQEITLLQPQPEWNSNSSPLIQNG